MRETRPEPKGQTMSAKRGLVDGQDQAERDPSERWRSGDELVERARAGADPGQVRTVEAAIQRL